MSKSINRLFIRLKKCKFVFRYFWFRIKEFFFGLNKKTERNILIDLTGLRINRRIVQVVYQIIHSGYSVYYKITPKCYINTYYDGLNDYQEYFFNHAQYYNREREYQVVFCGKRNTKNYKKRIVFCDNIKSFEKNYHKTYYYPILFHPIYLFQNREKMALEEKKCNKINMLFVGNNSDAYSRSSDKIHEQYGIETRNEVIDFLNLHFSDYIFRPDSKLELFSALQNELLLNKIVIVDEFRLDGDDYWNILKLSAFHIWTCGYSQPYCHNQVESMSCGTIPIYNQRIKYNGLNEQNSYSYHDFDGFAFIIKSLIDRDINSDTVKEKSNLIQKVYSENLSNTSFSNKLKGFIDSDEKEETYYICEGIYEE